MKSKSLKARLQLKSWGSSTVDDLISQRVDIGVNYYPMMISKQFVQRNIGQDSFVMLMNRNHPFEGEYITAEQVSEYPLLHLIINDFNHSNYTDMAIKATGKEPNTRLKSTYLMLLTQCLQDDEKLMLPCSEMFSKSIASELRHVPIRAKKYAPTGKIAVVHLSRFSSNPVHLWLIEELKAIINVDGDS